MHRPALALSFLLLTIPCLADENWPQFHGPNCDSHATATDLPVAWSETENVAWKTAIHGAGWSSPVVWANQIWLTTANEDGTQLSVVCVDRETGDIVHDILLYDDQTPEDDLVNTNSFASPTPCIEEGRVYVHFGAYGTACLDTASGDVLWSRRDLRCVHLRGPGSSPLLDGDRLFLHFDGADEQFVVALDAKTGETVWRTKRSTDFGDMDGDLRKAYDTPLMITFDGRKQLISTGAQAAMAYDPETGDELWKVLYRGFSNASRPVFDGRRVFLNTGFGKAKLLAVRPDGSGDVTDTHIDWVAERGVPLKPTPVLVEGRLYMADDKGVLTVLDASTGEQVSQDRIAGGKFSATPLVADGRIYIPSERGETIVVQPGAEPEVLAENELDEGCMASPIAVGNAIYLRTKTHLYRIEKR